MNRCQLNNMQKIMDIVCENLKIEKQEVVFAEIQKNALLVKTKNKPMTFFDKIRKLGKTHSCLIRNVSNVLDEMMLESMSSYVEAEYKAPIKYAIFFERTHKAERTESWFVIFFKKRVLDFQNSYSVQEDKIKREVSKILVDVTKRKVSENKMYVFSGTKYVWVFKGLFAEYEKKLLMDNHEYEKNTIEMTENIYENILRLYCMSKNVDTQPKVVSSIAKNRVVAFLDLHDD